MQKIFVGEPRHPRKKVKLCAFNLLNDPDRPFRIIKIRGNQLSCKPLSIACQRGQESLDIFRTPLDEEVHIVREPHVTMQGDGNSTHKNERHLSLSEAPLRC